MATKISVANILHQSTHPIGLAVFRIAFGILMFISAIRFWANGWIQSFYIKPVFFFKYFGFEWIPVPEPLVLYSLFCLLILSCLGIALGLFYRASIISFFILFSFFELLDKSYYLNHYYLVSLIALWLCFLPANRYASLDVYRQAIPSTQIPKVAVWLLRLQIGIVYFYAGAAKLGSDWLLEAMPMKIWLRQGDPSGFFGGILHHPATAYIASWFGCIYDLSIAFFLSWTPTRKWAYASVIVFHAATAYLFPIGVFPWAMMAFTLIFFPNSSFERLKSWFPSVKLQNVKPITWRSPALAAAGVFILFQLVFPLRSWAYPGSVHWHEQGFNFSWRVMRVEKTGHASFFIEDAKTGQHWDVYNGEFLNPVQEKMMAVQPELILQYADYLGDTLSKRYGIENPIIKADVFVSINGSKLQRFINPDVNLLPLKDGWSNKTWILSPEE